MSTHSFPVNVAKEYGINEAIILQHIYFWFQKNRANKKNFYDGTYWSYNTTEAFNDIFPYFTQRQIQYCLDKLKKEDLILTANYNHNKFDRTLWYSISEKGLTYFENTILQNCKMEETKMENGKCENVKSNTYINTNINTNIKKDCIALQGNFLKNEKGVSKISKPKDEDLTIEAFIDICSKNKKYIDGEHKDERWKEKYNTFKTNRNFKTNRKNDKSETVSLTWQDYLENHWLTHEWEMKTFKKGEEPVKVKTQKEIESEAEELKKWLEQDDYDKKFNENLQDAFKGSIDSFTFFALKQSKFLINNETGNLEVRMFDNYFTYLNYYIGEYKILKKAEVILERNLQRVIYFDKNNKELIK